MRRSSRRRRGPPVACSWARTRRPPSVTTRRARTTCFRRAAPGASRAHSGRTSSRGGSRPSRCRARRPGSSRRRSLHWPAPRASRCTPNRRRSGRRNRGMARTAEINRETKETRVRLRLDLDGGEAKVATGVGFLDHMLELLARHGRLGLDLEASGDLETGAHHTTEDVGICLGQAMDEALGDRAGIRRYGSALVPMDEALGECAIDISGRPYCAFDADLPDVTIAGFDTELAEEFFRAVSNNSKITLHIWVRSGSNAHHMVEASFKAFARALREAVSIDPDEIGVPSTKGTLSE